MMLYGSLLARHRLIAVLFVVCGLFALQLRRNADTVAQQGKETVVALLRSGAENPSEAQIEILVRNAVAQAGGLPAAVGPGKKIVIHPNLVNTIFTSGSGVVTHRQVVRTIVRMCMERGAESSNIKIAEGSAYYLDPTGREYPLEDPRGSTRKAFKDAGYDILGGQPGSPYGDMIDDATGVQLVDLNDVGRRYPDYPCYTGTYDTKYVTAVTPRDHLVRSVYYIPNVIMQADVLINVPVFKNHAIAGITGAIKLAGGTAPCDIYHASGNCETGPFGYKQNCFHNPGNLYDQDYNARALVDLNLCRRPDFVVVDALVGVTNGPVGSGDGGGLGILSPKMACILAGRDEVAVDTILALLMDYDPGRIPTITYAASRGLGVTDRKLITVRGLRVKLVRRAFPDGFGAGHRHELVSPTFAGWNVISGAYVFGTYGVTPSGVSDASGICKGEVFVDGVCKGANSASPWRVDLDATSLSPGSHTLQYVVYDPFLNEAVRTATIRRASDPRPSGALSLPDGTPVLMGQVVVSGAAPVLGGGVFFVQSLDRGAGFEVRWPDSGPGVSPGDVLILSGTIRTEHGHRYLSASAKTKVGTRPAPRPILVANRALGGMSGYPGGPAISDGRGARNTGLLVRSSGKVTAGGTDHFYIDDGSLAGGLKVRCGSFAGPVAGSRVSVTGFSSTESDDALISRLLVARAEGDIVIHANP